MGKQNSKLVSKVTTPDGVYCVGDVYVPADGANYKVTILDVDTYKEQEDIVIQCPNGTKRRVDWFKMSYRYKKET